jgi:glutathione S-transferase
MHRLLKLVDSELASNNNNNNNGGGDYFLGEFSLVDIMFTSFLERMAASLAYYKGMESRCEIEYPALYKWYVAMDTRPAYQGIKSDYVRIILYTTILCTTMYYPTIYYTIL